MITKKETQIKREALFKIKQAIDKMIYGMPDCACDNCRSFRKQTRLWNNFEFKGLICNHKEKHKDSCGNGRKEWTSKNLDSYEKGSIPTSLIKEIEEQSTGGKK